MASRLNPYLSFGHQGDSNDLVMHAMLETDRGFTLMASDTPPGMDRTEGSSIAISLSGDDEAELRGYWDRLSADAGSAV